MKLQYLVLPLLLALIVRVEAGGWRDRDEVDVDRQSRIADYRRNVQNRSPVYREERCSYYCPHQRITCSPTPCRPSTGQYDMWYKEGHGLDIQTVYNHRPRGTSTNCRGRRALRCSTGDQCITVTRRCDGVADCRDGSDETNCGYNRGRPQTNVNSKNWRPREERMNVHGHRQLKCANGRQWFDARYRCDHDATDCADGSDEWGCDAY